MNLTKTILVLALIVPVTIAAGFCAVAPDEHQSTPLKDQSLSAIRGADMQFSAFGNTSCEAMGLMALSQLYGGTWVSESGCGVANIGFGCGGCTTVMSARFGTKGVMLLNGGGQQNADIGACGNVEGGTCTVTNPGGYPLTYACTGIAVAMNPNNGQPYACSDLIGVTNQ